jgi:hypothetical protein
MAADQSPSCHTPPASAKAGPHQQMYGCGPASLVDAACAIGALSPHHLDRGLASGGGADDLQESCAANTHTGCCVSCCTFELASWMCPCTQRAAGELGGNCRAAEQHVRAVQMGSMQKRCVDSQTSPEPTTTKRKKPSITGPTGTWLLGFCREPATSAYMTKATATCKVGTLPCSQSPRHRACARYGGRCGSWRWPHAWKPSVRRKAVSIGLGRASNGCKSAAHHFAAGSRA